MSLRWSHMKIPIAMSAVLLVMAALAGPVAAAGAGPKNLSAERAEGGIQLAWEAPSSNAGAVTGYRIERMRPLQDEHAFTTLVSNTGNTDTAYLDTSPTVDNVDGDIYAYRVRALRDDEVSRTRRKDYASTTWYVPASDPVEPPSTNPNFEDRCQEDLTAGNAVACSMGSFASVRQDEGGAYEIDWSTWDADPAQSEVTGYTVTRQRMMEWYFLRLDDGVWVPAGAGTVREYLKPGTCEPGMSGNGAGGGSASAPAISMRPPLAHRPRWRRYKMPQTSPISPAAWSRRGGAIGGWLRLSRSLHPHQPVRIPCRWKHQRW